MLSISRLAIKGAPISKRLLKPLVDEGKVLGWDDPRLPTLDGLKRRGIKPEAIKTFVLSFGLSTVESEPDWTALLNENKKLVEGLNARIVGIAFVIELAFLKGRERLKGYPVHSIIRYE